MMRSKIFINIEEMSVHSDTHKTYERALKAKNYVFHSFYTVAAAKEFLSELNNPELKLCAEVLNVGEKGIQKQLVVLIKLIPNTLVMH
jgi:hypothetical protein